MESLRVAGGRERQSSCVDPRRIQLLNQQSELLFGREHLFKPDFTAPMPLPQSYTSPDEEELLGVEYALCQSTNFASREYYISQSTMPKTLLNELTDLLLKILVIVHDWD